MNISDAHKKADPKAFYFAKDQKQLVDRYDEAAGVYDEAMSTDVGWTGHVELAAVVAVIYPPKPICWTPAPAPAPACWVMSSPSRVSIIWMPTR